MRQFTPSRVRDRPARKRLRQRALHRHPCSHVFERGVDERVKGPLREMDSSHSHAASNDATTTRQETGVAAQTTAIVV
jgi:hypothetical protein